MLQFWIQQQHLFWQPCMTFVTVCGTPVTAYTMESIVCLFHHVLKTKKSTRFAYKGTTAAFLEAIYNVDLPGKSEPFSWAENTNWCEVKSADLNERGNNHFSSWTECHIYTSLSIHRTVWKLCNRIETFSEKATLDGESSSITTKHKAFLPYSPFQISVCEKQRAGIKRWEFLEWGDEYIWHICPVFLSLHYHSSEWQTMYCLPCPYENTIKVLRVALAEDITCWLSDNIPSSPAC